MPATFVNLHSTSSLPFASTASAASADTAAASLLSAAGAVVPVDLGQQQALANALAPHCFVRSLSESQIILIYVAPYSSSSSGSDSDDADTVAGVRVELYECDRAFLVTPRSGESQQHNPAVGLVWQQVEQCYRQSFVSAVYAQLTDQQTVSSIDLDKALSTCEEHIVMVPAHCYACLIVVTDHVFIHAVRCGPYE